MAVAVLLLMELPMPVVAVAVTPVAAVDNTAQVQATVIAMAEMAVAVEVHSIAEPTRTMKQGLEPDMGKWKSPISAVVALRHTITGIKKELE